MAIQITQKKVNSKKFTYSARWRVYEQQKIVASGKQSGFYTRKDAEDWANDEYEKHALVKSKPATYTVETLLNDWADMRKTKLAPSTYKGYKVNIAHMVPHIGQIKPVDLSFTDIQKMADALSEKKLKEKTVRYCIRTLHAAINYAVVRMRIMTYNPAVGIEIAPDETPFVATLYSAELLLKMLDLLKEMNHELYAPVLLASNRGLRRGEALALEWSQIDWEGKITRIKESYNKVKEGPSTRPVKSKKSARKVSVQGEFARKLKDIKDRREADGRFTRWICENEDGTRMEASHVSRALGLFQKANNFPVCRFHDLRHTCAKINVEAGVDIETLSKMLGHSKISITSEIYLQENMTMFHQAADAVDEKIFKLKKKEEDTEKTP
jgi:integrase